MLENSPKRPFLIEISGDPPLALQMYPQIKICLEIPLFFGIIGGFFMDEY